MSGPKDPLLEFWSGEGIAVIHLSKLRPLLAQLGYHIVNSAEQNVLEACAAFPTEHLDIERAPMLTLADRQRLYELGERWREAELARRAAK